MSGTLNFLNSGFDLKVLNKELTENTRLVVPDFFNNDFCEEVRHCLLNEVPWQIAYRDGQKDCVADLAQVQNMPVPEQQKFMNNIQAVARNGYQFFFNRYPMIQAYVEQWDSAPFLKTVVEMFNTPEVVDLMKELTGEKAIRKVEVFASRYLNGHFLKLHDDHAEPGLDRRFAFVLGLTKDWEADWGGLTQFVEDGNVVASVCPGFANLAIFKLPQDHLVSYVVPHATRPRLTITGWLRAD